MVSRQWRGVVRVERAEDYVAHLRSETLPQLEEIAGFVSARVVKRRVAQGVEFLVVTEWESVEAIERFAGQDVEAAVVPERAQAMMVEYDERARHYEVVV
jgi:heme-degrading monooxygenase HmoA